MSRNWFVWLFLVGWLAGCGGGTEPATDNAQVLRSSVMIPGKFVTTDAGVAFGAPTGSLAAPVDLLVEQPASVAVPLPDWVQAVGTPYRVGTRALTIAPSDSTFAIGLPLPEGKNPANLAIAVLAHEGDRMDGPVTDDWVVLDTQYDATRKLLITGLSVLFPDGRIAIVVWLPSAPGAATQSVLNVPDTPTAVETIAQWLNDLSHLLAPRTAFAALAEETPLVKVECSEEFDPVVAKLYLGYKGCNIAALQSVASWFEEALTLFRNAGYPEPYLRRERIWHVGPTNLISYTDGPYIVELVPCEAKRQQKIDWLGEYYLPQQSMWVCTEETGLAPKARYYVRHELFHAIQFSFQVPRAQFLAKQKPLRWQVEAQATAAMHSTGLMLRAPNYLARQVDDSLLAESTLNEFKDTNIEYRTQDFWGYLGARSNRGLNLFLPFLQRGLLPDDVDASLKAGMPSLNLGDLATAYWEWAKNQAYEWQTILETGIISGLPLPTPRTPCTYDSDVIAHSSSITATFDPVTGSLNNKLDLPSLDPLTSKIFTITLQAPQTYIAKISVNSGDADLKYKIYLASWGDTCAPRPENQPTNAGVDTGSPEVVYVLVANTSYTDALGPSEIVVDVLRIAVEPPEISITANDDLPRPASFDILSDGTGTFNYKATSTESWLTITQGATGTITANDTTRVSLEVVCKKPYPTIPGLIALEFTDQAGNVLSGTDVPAAVPVTLTCKPTQYDCADLANVDPFGPVEGTFDVSWSAGGSRPAGGGTVGAQVRHVATALTGISQFPPSYVTMSGTASIDRRVDYDYGGGRTRTEIDSFHTLNAENCRSQSIVSVDPSRCTYDVAVDILVQGTRTIETTDPNNGTTTTVVNDVCETAAIARYAGIPYATLGFSGSVQLTVDSGDIQLGGSPTLLQALFPDKYQYLSDLPPAGFSWSIKPSYYPSAGVPQ